MGNLVTEGTKVCSKCKLEKDVTEFNKNSTAKDGRQRYCRECNKMYGRKYYEDNSDGIKQQRKDAAQDRKHLEALQKMREDKENADGVQSETGDREES